MDNITKEIFSLKPSMTELYKVLRRKELYSNFIDRDINTQYNSLVNEIKELQVSLLENNKEEVLKEFSDVIFVLWLFIQWLLKNWILTKEDLNSIPEIISSKIYQRSPQLLYWKKESIEIEEDLWIKWKK